MVIDSIFLYSIASVIFVSLISLIGLLTLPIESKKMKELLIYFVAFAAGALLGDALLHLLPEAVEKLGFGPEVSIAALAGVVVMFVIEKIIHWRHVHTIDHSENSRNHSPFAITNLVGDFFHNFIDGIIIAASFVVSIPVGIATTLAVVFHEIPQEIGDFGVLVHGGFSKWDALKVNFLTAIAAVAGVLLVFLFGADVADASVWLLPFAAGNFIYIAGSDLIPELHKEVKWKNSFAQLACFVLGIATMVALLGLE